MTVHNEAAPGEIAPTVLLPGDPLRAKFIAEHFLESPVCYNRVRGMLGYTGTFNGVSVSVQGTGMGLPSHSIYVHELINVYSVKQLIRIGSCGSLQPDINLRDVLIAMSACTDSAMNTRHFDGMTFAPTASYPLLAKAAAVATESGIPFRCGSILSSDTFYGEDPDDWKRWAKYGIMAIEMETAALYTLAARFGVQALTLLTVSDSLVTHETTTPEEREKSFTEMMHIALQLTV